MASGRLRGNEIGSTGKAVAANVARIRKSQQLSLSDVSERLAAVGHKLSPSGLSKIENTERRVDVDDLMALASVLDVSPLGLLLPTGAPDEVAEVTGAAGAVGLIWRWAFGEFSPRWSPARTIAARSLPEWLTVESEIDPKPRRAELELSFVDPFTGNLEVAVKQFDHLPGLSDG